MLTAITIEGSAMIKKENQNKLSKVSPRQFKLIEQSQIFLVIEDLHTENLKNISLPSMTTMNVSV